MKASLPIALALALLSAPALAQQAPALSPPKTVEQNLTDVLRSQVHGMLDANANLQAQNLTLSAAVESARKEIDALKAKNATAPATGQP